MMRRRAVMKQSVAEGMENEQRSVSGLIGGGLGNLVDRILFGGVTDYIRLSLIRFPIFNFADICITVSVAALMLLLLFDHFNDKTEERHG